MVLLCENSLEELVSKKTSHDPFLTDIPDNGWGIEPGDL